MPGKTGTAKKRSAKTGLPPGFLIHIGEKHSEKAKITLREYDETYFREKEISTLDGVLPSSDRAGVAWIHIDGLQEIHLLEQMGSVFNLHPLILEDILNTEQRPKSEDHDEYYYIVLRLFCEDADDGFVPEQISIVLGSNWLISLQEKEGKLLDPVRERLRNEKGRLRRAGADYLAHALLDVIVDSVFPVLDKFGEKIEILEEKLVGSPSPKTLQSIQTLKREMIFLRKSVWPLREMIGGLARSDSSLIHESSVIYFRDIYDHVVQVIDTIETYRDMLSGMLDIYLSSVSNRMNEIMKVLTLIATLFMPLTFLVGVYGMNFKYMPELEWQWGYFVLWGLMIVTAVVMLFYFKRKKWL
ncbi:MAG: magnesium and cobalt transport protein CorA [Syntrophus sp. (in: bacteria)]|nr:magnesium and cobalt transport protein CorA [Syntrophus sp. (in: bacteria)]